MPHECTFDLSSLLFLWNFTFQTSCRHVANGQPLEQCIVALHKTCILKTLWSIKCCLRARNSGPFLDKNVLTTEGCVWTLPKLFNWWAAKLFTAGWMTVAVVCGETTAGGINIAWASSGVNNSKLIFFLMRGENLKKSKSKVKVNFICQIGYTCTTYSINENSGLLDQWHSKVINKSTILQLNYTITILN